MGNPYMGSGCEAPRDNDDDDDDGGGSSGGGEKLTHGDFGKVLLDFSRGIVDKALLRSGVSHVERIDQGGGRVRLIFQGWGGDWE